VLKGIRRAVEVWLIKVAWFVAKYHGGKAMGKFSMGGRLTSDGRREFPGTHRVVFLE
jgi:hypothetical protein